MFPAHRLLLAMAAASSIALSPSALALGLGEANLHSALGQPLRADIPLLDSRDLSAEEIIVRLASPEAYARAGLSRPDQLLGLRVAVQRQGGQFQARLSTPQAIHEPYLGLLLEVVWPGGQQVREYSLLLDPPHYQPQLPAGTLLAQPASPRAALSKAPVQSATRPAPQHAAQPGGQYRTQANDRLWDIAQAVRGAATPHQAMLAIQQLNPQAFIDGNINRLKRDQTLQLPSAEQMQAMAAGQALQLSQQQQQAWQSSQRQLDARPRQQAATAPAHSNSGDTLRLAGSPGSQQGRGEQGSENTQLSEQLAKAEEGLDLARRENAELHSRIADLQSQLDKLQRLLQLKDSQLATLQAQLAAQQAAQQPLAHTQP